MISEQDNFGTNKLVHGGDIYSATQTLGEPAQGWLDLSTGINPYSYPIPAITPNAWQQLPYLNPQVQLAANTYYGSEQMLISAGSQPVIVELPRLLRQLGNGLPILMPDIGYQEHRVVWSDWGTLVDYSGLEDATKRISQAINTRQVGHLLLINPNNPSAICYCQEQVLAWASALAQCNGFVVIDEAFMDACPALSILNPACLSLNISPPNIKGAKKLPENLVVLRSFGKFFGLAGVRIGATYASDTVRQALAEALGPWCINGPAQQVAMAAWQDRNWQQSMVQRLRQEQPQQLKIWQTVFAGLGAQLQGDTPLFRSFLMAATVAQQVYTHAAQAGILLRPIAVNDTHKLLRIGNIDLGNQQQIMRCQQWLAALPCVS